MRIAMLTNNYRPFMGGVPISVERQAKELVKLGNQVTVFAPEYREIPQTSSDSHLERVIRYRAGKRKMKNGMVYPRMISKEILEVFEKEEFDCIHVHHPMFVGPVALYLGKKYNLPVIYTYHTRYEDYLHYIGPFTDVENRGAVRRKVYTMGKEKVVPGYMRWFTNQCDMVIAPGAGIQEMMRRGGTKTPVSVLPTGLEDTFYIKDEEKSGAIRAKYLSGRKHLFCTVSRLEKEKNPRFLLNGIARLKERMISSFRVLFIGEGSMRAELEGMAAELGITKEIVFVGNLDNEETKHYLNACELFLFASKSETQGIVLAEAFAAGNPVVAVKASGVEDIVKNGCNGYMTEEDIEEWTTRVLDAIKNENYKELQRQAELTASGFRSSALAVYEESLYVQCIKRREAEREYENETNWTGNLSTLIYRLFKAS